MGSIFEQYYEIPAKIEDRFSEYEGNNAVDVIIPLLNSNELFERNLYCYYKEIPIRRLLIGDGGTTDGSLEIAKKFPRCEIFDHREYISQGYSIKKLIEEVSSEYFIYLHADVFLPLGWFDKMIKHKEDFDWYECDRKMTVLFQYTQHEQNKSERAYSGSQIGNSRKLKNVAKRIDDDYLQRNEDIIFMELVETDGHRYGRVHETFHYHQIMNKRGETEPDIDSIQIKKSNDIDWEIAIYQKQVKGIIKYLSPNKEYLKQSVKTSINILRKNENFDEKEFLEWVERENNEWVPFVKHCFKKSIKEMFKSIKVY